MGQTAELNNAVEYIESHLGGEIDIAQAARLAVCSGFHFQRVSSYMAGVTLTEYIRRRQMTLAAFEPAEGGASIIDMAQKYGYESPTAFNRAFQSVHGVAPSAARQQGIPLTAYPRLAFHLSIRGGLALNYRILKKRCLPHRRSLHKGAHEHGRLL